MALLMTLATVKMNIVVGESQFTGKVNRTTDAGPDVNTVALEPAYRGAVLGLPTTIGFPGGHPFINGDVVDVHWGDDNIRRGTTVNNTTSTFIDFSDTGEGEVAIPELEDVWVSLQTQITVNIDPTKIALVATGTSRQGYADFRDASGSLFLRKMERRESWFWLDNYTWENLLLGGTNVIEVTTSTRDIRGGQFFVFFHYDA